MPPASRRRTKKAKNKKLRTLTTATNHHSSPTVQLQGHFDDLKLPLKQAQSSLPPICLRYPYVVVEEKKGNTKGNPLSAVAAAFAPNHSRMEGSLREALEEENQKVEILGEEDNKEVVAEVAANNETPDGDSSITDVHKEDVSESAVDILEPAVSSPKDAIKGAQIENTQASDTVEWELKEEQEKDSVYHEPEEPRGVKGLEETKLPPSEDNNEFSSVPENVASRVPEVVETVKDVMFAEEEKNILCSVVTDVASKETLETTPIPKSNEGEKVPLTTPETIIPRESEKSWEPSKDEKLGDVQEPSHESAKDESSQPLANVPDAEDTSVTAKIETEVPRSNENQIIVSETQREHASWRSCCGIFEILLGAR